MALNLKKKKTPKTESLTIRLDPKMRFALEFVARIKGQTITKVIERAIVDLANNEKILHTNEYSWADFSEYYTTWKDYWDPNEGIRFLNLAKDNCIDSNFDEESCFQFMNDHKEYFFPVSPDYPIRENFDVLWPMMSSLLDVWEETKSTDRTKVENIMNEALKKANLPIPSEKNLP